ncbi:4-coumarate--CoA ligase 1-like [Coccinella septempunctata]|uniref:4-coumarate--CoA ligase 1-like n=1 Tax=Coccinella septempunctata TaxID=41139 RepID=UPI001D08BC64|nr:4-coumarate--CoA ligase 1-like [Coccinella septempunctata]
MAVNPILRPIFNLSRRLRPVSTSSVRFSGSTSEDPNILKSPFGAIDVPRTNITDFLFEKTSKWGHLISTECPITGRKYTHDEIQRGSRNLAGALRKKLKLNRKDVVGILLPNTPEMPIAALGILHGGMAATTLNPTYTPEEICRQLLDSGAKALITLTDFWPVAKKAVEMTKRNLYILTINTKEGQATPSGAINFAEFIREKIEVDDRNHISHEDIAFMPYSSGTTGLPKGVLLTHSNMLSNLAQLDVPGLNYLEESTNDHQDVIPVILPQFHIYGLLVSMILSTSRGCKHVSIPKFEPKLFIEVLAKYRPHVLFVAPPLVIFMSTQDAVKAEYLSRVRSIVSGAAPLGASDEERFKKKVNVFIGQGYGMTETSPVIAMSTNDGKATPGSTGTPVPSTEIKFCNINDLEGAALGHNQPGEILVRGPQVMKGYHLRPKETEETLLKDGWLRTGDIGFYDERGCITITDRLKELIKVKGFQVPPAELEEVIREYPDVVEVGVIGIPDERSGQVPRAYVVMKPGAQFDEKKIQDFVRNKVASYKELKGGVSAVESLPMNASGKILRRQLRELYEKDRK